MKKLFLFAALLMTGFAFYSCEDVVDNPAKDPAQSWNYSVSVKFADFDFNGAVDENSVPYTYKAPTTLYVLNEENTLMGTITTDAAPAIGDYGTYAGTLTGSIGNNLIITTKIGNDLGKQDGTLKSAIENGIVQTAEVPIKIYNANSGTLTTASAKMENTAAIAHVHTYQLNGGDKVKFSDESKSFEWTVNEDFEVDFSDYWNTTTIYIAIPTNGDPEAEYTISTDGVNGYTLGATFDNTNLPLNTGKLSGDLGSIVFEELGIDLTKYDAYYRANSTNKTTGYYTFYQNINDDKSFTITQSGGQLDSISVEVSGNTDKNVALTIDNIKLGEGRSFRITGGAKFDLTLIGENEFESLDLRSPYTTKGTGSWKFNELYMYGDYDQTWNSEKGIYEYKVNYAPEFTITENIDLAAIRVYNGAKLNIANGVKVNLKSKNYYPVAAERMGTINIGNNATVNVEKQSNSGYGVYLWSGGIINVGESATFKVQGRKNAYALYMKSSDNCISTISIGKKGNVIFDGALEGTIGRGAVIYAYANSPANISLKEEANLTITGIDNGALECNASGDSDTKKGEINFDIAENASVAIQDTGMGYGMQLYNNDYGRLNITGKGAFTAVGGEDKAAISLDDKALVIGTEIKSFTAKSGMTTSPICILDQNTGDEAKIDVLVADKTKFNDATADGIRTITPKAE